MGEELKVINLGTINRKSFDLEEKSRKQSLEPDFSRKMFKKNGVITKLGRVFTEKELMKYNLI